MHNHRTRTVGLLVGISLCLLPCFSEAQGEPVTQEFVIFASYQFNTLKHPTGLAIATYSINGVPQPPRLFIADTGNHVIRVFNSGSGSLTVFAGAVGQAGYVNSVPFSSARFKSPTGLKAGCWAWTTNGVNWNTSCEVFANDAGNFVVRRMHTGGPNGPPTMGTVAGNHAQGFVDGPSTSASFATLAGLYVGDYIGDGENYAIRAWDGTNVTTFAGTGTPGFSNGYRTSAQFNTPTDVARDTNGKTYVVDAGNHVVRKIDTAGNVTTFAGTGQPGYADGPGDSAQFYMPVGTAYGADDMLYVADCGNNRIRRVDAAGIVTTYAGGPVGGLVNGSLSQARFQCPVDLVISGSFMYVSDSMNNVIRRIDMTAGTVSTYIN